MWFYYIYDYLAKKLTFSNDSALDLSHCYRYFLAKS